MSTQEEGLLAELEEIAPVGTWRWEPEAELLECSAGMTRMAGAQPPAPGGLAALLACFHPDDRARIEELHRRAATGGEPFAFAARLLRPDGATRPVRARALVAGAGGTRAVLGILHGDAGGDDRTPVAERLESFGQLVGGIAHEYNNMLAVIINYAAFLSEELGDREDLREHVEELRAAAERAAELTRRLLVFGRRDLPQPASVDLDELVGHMEPIMRRRLGEDVALEVDLGAAGGCVEGDRGRLEQVLLNLVINAREAMPGGGALAVETRALGQELRLRVRDTGRGMDERVAELAFEPFFTTKPAGAGAGLGLATVQALVREAGGRVELESVAGEGTTVEVRLPLHDRPAAGGRPAGPAAQPEALEAPAETTILLVEDEQAVARVTRRILERHGYRVLATGGPEAALEAVREHPGRIDLLLTDVVMPGLSGPELAERVAELRPGTRVLYASGYPREAMERRGLSDSDVALLDKPFTEETLLSAVRDALSRGSS